MLITKSTQKLLASVLVLIMLFSITAGYVYAADPVIIESSGEQRNYFQYLNASGEWNDLDRRDHGVASTGAIAYCMNAGDDSPHPFHSFSPGEDIFTTFGFSNFSIGLENIFFYGFPSTSPSVHGLTDRQARYATAMAISCFLSENGYDQGSDFYNLSAGTLRPDGTPEGQATWDYFQYLLNYARAANPIARSVSVAPTTDTYIDGSYYARSYRITATNCNSGYTIDAASLPSGYEILGYTGAFGETITVRIPSAGNANTPFSFRAIGWDNRTAANLIIQESTTDGIQTMMYQSLIPFGGPYANGNIEGDDIDIEIDKLDLATGNPVGGAEITVWTDANRTNIFRVLETQPDGTALFVDVPEGTYYWSETRAPEGYVLNSELHTFIVAAGSATGTFEVYNEKTELELIKTDASDNRGLPGAHFVIYNSSGVVVAEGDTDAAGRCLFTGLPVGSYTFGETLAPSGYTISSNQPGFAIRADGSITGTTTIANTRQEYQLAIRKNKESATFIDGRYLYGNLPAAGISFDVFAAEEIRNIHGEVIYTAGQIVETITTSTLGIAQTSVPIYPGQYTAREKATAEGLVADLETSYSINVEPTNQTDQIVEIYFNDGEPVLNSAIKAYLQINKVDAETLAPLEGVKFEVYSEAGDLIETLTTDTNGQATTSLLPYGNYTLLETETLAGYVLADEQEFSIFVAPVNGVYQTQNLTVSNTPIKAYLQINKVDSETLAPLQGVEFEVYSEAGDLIETLTTDTNGQATTSLLPYGNYTLLETETLAGYVLADEQEFSIFVAPVNGVYQTQNLTIRNTPIKAYLQINKVDAETLAPLQGVEFEVYSEAGELIETLITDATGQAKTSLLPYGNYTLLETETLAGYVLADEQEFSIFVAPVNGVYQTQNLTIRNTPIKAYLQINKVDSETLAPLEGVKFEVYSEAGDLIETLTTDSNGQATTSLLPYGNYTLLETETLAGYVLADEQEFSIFVAPVNGVYQTQNLTVSNVFTSLLVQKRSPSGEKLANMGFTIKSESTGALMGLQWSEADQAYLYDAITSNTTGVTRTNGDALVLGLPVGEYVVTEVFAPKGYLLDSVPVRILVNGSGVAAAFINNPSTGTPKTGETTKPDVLPMILSGVAVVLFSVALSITPTNKKKGKKKWSENK